MAATISSSGPLTSIGISPVLNCSVNHTGDSLGEWYGGTACGTFVAVGSVLYGPTYVPAGGSATGTVGYTPFTPVSQVSSGAGTVASPYLVTTVVTAGTSGIRLTEHDSYITGQEAYRTDIVATNTKTSGSVSGIVYHAGDCYLQDSDFGLGQVIGGSAPVCKASPTSVNPNRIEAFFPITGGNSFVEDYYGSVWHDVGLRTALPDTCKCSSNIDNAAAVAWATTVSAGASHTYSLLTEFSPLGSTPLAFSKTADHGTATAGGTDGYTITVSNAGATSQTLNHIVDTLPSGFSYVAGSTTGVTTANPAIAGQAVTWTGPFPVPAASGSTPGRITLHFRVAIATGASLGTHTNSVTGDGTGVSVLPASEVAPVQVMAPPTPTPSHTPTPSTHPSTSHGVEPASTSRAPTHSASPTVLASTGSQTATLATIGLISVLVGLLLTAAALRRPHSRRGH